MEGEVIQNFSKKFFQSSHIYIFPFSSIDDSEAESSIVEFEIVSDWLPLSLSEVPDGLSSTGCFKNQYIILAVNVRIIFWFTWKSYIILLLLLLSLHIYSILGGANWVVISIKLNRKTRIKWEKEKPSCTSKTLWLLSVFTVFVLKKPANPSMEWVNGGMQNSGLNLRNYYLPQVGRKLW